MNARYGWVFLAAVLLLIPSASAVAADASADANAEITKFISLLNLDYPPLKEVREQYEAGHLQKAMDAYKQFMVHELATSPAYSHNAISDDPKVMAKNFWMWTPTDPKALLEDGVLTMYHTSGNMAGSEWKSPNTSVKIGFPPHTNWIAKAPDGDYSTILWQASMLWNNQLAYAFVKTNDPRYASRWVGYWADFGRNWLEQYHQAETDPQVIAATNKSIGAGEKSTFWVVQRTRGFVMYLQAMARAHPDTFAGSLNSNDLAAALTYIVSVDLQHATKNLDALGGVPNQRLALVLATFHAGLVLPGFKESPHWRALGIASIKNYFSHQVMPDGSNTEQSFNYNKGIMNSIRQIQGYVPRLSDVQMREMLIHQSNVVAQYTAAMLTNIRTPNGEHIVSIGNGPYHEAAWWPEDFTGLTVAKSIYNAVTDPSAALQPIFKSVYFPYGGYAVMRTDWTPTSFWLFFKNSRPGQGHHREGGNGIQLWAYGKPLLVNSGTGAYARNDFARYFDSTISQNSICVDGYSQLLNGGDKNRKDVPVTYMDPIQARWHAGKHLDFVEGNFMGPYGGWNFLTDGKAVKAVNHAVKVNDVTHQRQVYFLRGLGAWIVTDRLHSPAQHRYTQSWCFDWTWKPENLKLDKEQHAIKASIPGQPGIELYQFGIPSSTYSSFYGIDEDNQTLGWFHKTHDGKGRTGFYPAPDVHVDWTGKGDQLMATLIVPNPKGDSRIKSIHAINQGAGFDAVLTDGTQVSYRSSLQPTELQAAGQSFKGTNLLVVTPTTGDAWCVTLDAPEANAQASVNEVFDIVNGKAINNQSITIPTGFSWQADAEGKLAPNYTQNDPVFNALRTSSGVGDLSRHP